MKRPIIAVMFSVLLLLALFPTSQGKRVKSERTPTTVVKEKSRRTVSKSATTSQPERELLATPPKQSVAEETAPAADHEIPWQSLNAGGGPVSETDYSLNGSFGQSITGFVSSAGKEGGIGYWYGVCSCPFQGDFDEDGFLTALDLSALIDVLFAGQPNVQEAECPVPRADFDCDGFSTSLDLSRIIDHLFAGGDGPCDPCAR